MTDAEPGATWLICYCRAGFEAECAQEAVALARTGATHAAVEAAPASGFVALPLPADGTANSDWRSHIFARQCLPAFARLDGLARADRLGPIVAALRARGEKFHDAWVEAADSDEGHLLTPFCRSFGNALIGALRKEHLLDPSARRRLHAFFPAGDRVFLAAADPDLSAPWPQGIPRLKFPREAPSRSTLKLEEALLVLLDDDERARWLKPGMTAVDLGASPGGWTWQLVRRSLRVTAVDNGPMDRALMQSGIVTHLREDGFRFRPRKPVDWLFCDMVEQPRRIAELVARWLGERWCRRAIFNLKLPMKKRWEETQRCLGLLRDGVPRAEIRARQLYHDREEITAYCAAR
jgi:23S rRNA (cytidine2498-2'-O)-methyltransferase